MNSDEDPFMAVMSFIEGKSRKAMEFGSKLNDAFDTLLMNVYMSFILAVIAMLVLLFAAPVLMDSSSARLINMGAFMHVSAGILMICHQLPSHSFIFDGIPMPVCARDVGIYMGSVLGFLTVFLKERPKILSSIKIAFAATVPIAIDGITQSILLLRESNNLLRLLTGLIFGFGIIAYISNRIFIRWYPKFRQQVWESRIIAADAVAVVFVIYIMTVSTGISFGTDYMSRTEAAALAQANSAITHPAAVRTYYVSSLTPLSIQVDTFYQNHRDNVLDDIRASDFSRNGLELLANRTEQSRFGDNRTTEEILTSLADNEHRLGIWAVAVLSEEPVQGDAPFISGGAGEYFYYDAYTRKLIMEKTH